MGSKTSESEFYFYGRNINPHWANTLTALGWPTQLIAGAGAYVEGIDGRSYLDMVAGYGSLPFGHSPGFVISAIEEALQSGMPSLSPAATSLLSGRVAQQILALTCNHFSKVWFGNSGSEGIDAAMKFSVAVTGRKRFVSVFRGFHGTTTAAVSIAGGGNWRAPFEPILLSTVQVDSDDIGTLQDEFAKGDVAALIIEPVQGMGGGTRWKESALQTACVAARECGTLIVFDEVLTGLARTGEWFGYQLYDGCVPDMLVISKGLTGGFIPCSAVVMTDRIFETVFGPSGCEHIHSSTFSECTLAMAAAEAVLSRMRNINLAGIVKLSGKTLFEELEVLRTSGLPLGDIRGAGLLLSIEIIGGSEAAWRTCCSLMELGVRTLLAPHRPESINLTPPLTITRPEIARFVSALRKALS